MSDKIKEKVTNRIIETLESGVIPWRKPWSGIGSGDPMNPITGTVYSGINRLVLGCSDTKYNLFMTYKQASKIGAQVKKGAKGLPCTFYCTKVKDKATGEHKKTFFMQCYTVFKVEDIEGVDYILEQHARPIVSDNLRNDMIEALLADIISDTGIELMEGGSRACYNSYLDKVSIPPLEAFKSAEHYYHTLFHEFTHATGIPTRLDRDMSGNFGSQSYAREELTAELGAAMLAASVGMDSPELHQLEAAYIQNWLIALHNDIDLVFKASAQAEKAHQWLLNNHKQERIAA